MVERVVQHDESAQTEAGKEEGGLRSGRAGPGHQAPEVFAELLPCVHVPAPSGRPAIAAKVGRRHRHPQGNERLAHGGVQPGMVAESVEEDDGGTWRAPRKPGADEESFASRTLVPALA